MNTADQTVVVWKPAYRKIDSFNVKFRNIIKSYTSNYIFIHIPKTGGTSVKKLLRHQIYEQLGHVTAAEYLQLLKSRKLLNSKFSFTFVRNPWDRVVSYYFHERYHVGHRTGVSAMGLSMEDFIKICFRDKNFTYFKQCAGKYRHYLGSSQLAWLQLNDEMLVKYIGRYETLERDFEYIRTRLFPAPINKPLPHVNYTLFHKKNSRDPDYRGYYTDETADIVGQFYAQDIEYFKYSF